eukprot:TRINITY_DN908_c0_g3_i1.p1 TRINITY_DN908_c0_g3~~TRINITY_DN908_c0_g3_i1.p1  ORF type:complete len:801 (-),score=149.66 TRINITY_DN908_c0_g3_i1:5-2059(-)
MTTSSWPTWFGDQGAFEPLTEYFLAWSRDTRVDQTAEFAARVFYSYQYGGDWWASPVTIETKFLMYRKDTFREVLGHGRAPATYDELERFAKKVNSSVDNMWGIILPGSSDTQTVETFSSFLHAQGGEYYNDNELCVLTEGKAFNKAMDLYTGFYEDKLSPTYDQKPKQIANNFLYGYDENSDTEGYAAMIIDYWPYFEATSQKWANGGKNIGIAPLPEGPAGQFNFLGGWGLALGATSNHKEAAWEWIRFLSDPSSDGFMTRFCTEHLCIPSRVEAQGTPSGYGMCRPNLVFPFSETPLAEAIDATDYGVSLGFPRASSPVVNFINSNTLLPKQIRAVSERKYGSEKAAQEICQSFDDEVTIYRAPTPYSTDTSLEDDWMHPMLIVNSVFLGLTLVGGVCCVLFRAYGPIHSASWSVCVLTWLGCALGFVALYWWIIRPPDDWMCYCRMWFAPIVFTLLFGVLSAKTWRTNRLFSSKKFKPTPIALLEVLEVTAVLMIYPLIVVAVWTGVGDPRVEFVDVVNEDETHFKQCDYNNYWVFMGLLYGYFGVMLLVNCYLAFRVRTVNYQFNETKDIICAVYTVTLLAAVAIPLVHVFHNLPKAAYGITICGAWAAISVFLVSLFGVKVYPLFTGKPELAESSFGATTASDTGGKNSLDSIYNTSRGEKTVELDTLNSEMAFTQEM